MIGQRAQSECDQTQRSATTRGGTPLTASAIVRVNGLMFISAFGRTRWI
jgi:hypothetical protein